MQADTLRKSILQYAVQGKLVPQVESEESVSVLLEKIKAEKLELVRKGKIKKEKLLPPITDDEEPFVIPDSWKWVRFSDVAILFTGDSINEQEKKSKFTGLFGGYNYIATKDVWFDHTIDYNNGIKIPFDTGLKVAKANSSLLCIEGGSAGRKVGILNQDVCFGNKLCCFDPLVIEDRYLYYYLQSPAFTENFKDNTSGMIGGVGVNSLKTFYFALPPLAEQQRIVVRITELMEFVNDYEKRQVELEKMETEFPEKLKRSILEYAIEGKIVPQKDTEEPANILLEKIFLEKENLIINGTIKKVKTFPNVTEGDKPFDIPNSWEWVRLDTLTVENISYGIIKLGDEDAEGVPVLRCSDVKYGEIVQNNIRKVRKSLSEQYERTILNGGELLVNIRGTLGGCAVVPNNMKGYNIAREIAKISVSKEIDTQFILLIFMAPYFQQYVFKSLRGIAYKGLNIELLKQFTLPLPPFSEQRRIVARVEELFGLVDLITSGRKMNLKKSEIAMTNSNVINMPMQLKEIKFDVSTLGMVARKEDGVSKEDIASALVQVQEFYENKT